MITPPILNNSAPCLHLTATNVITPEINHLVQVPPFLFKNVLITSSTDDPAELCSMLDLQPKGAHQSNRRRQGSDQQSSLHIRRAFFVFPLHCKDGTQTKSPFQSASYVPTNEIIDAA